MKIRQKLVLAFGVLILILLIEIIFNQIITNRADQTYQTLQSKINPAINILDDYKSINKELNLLHKDRIYGLNNTETVNRYKGIIEVELMYIRSELSEIKAGLPEEDSSKLLMEQLIVETDTLIHASSKIDNLLTNNKEHLLNIMLAQEVYNTEISESNLIIFNSISELNLIYKRAFDTYNAELAYNLKSVSNIILITGILGTLLAIIITVQITRAISVPIYELRVATLKMSKGYLDKQIQIKGKGEFADLGKSFNAMSAALKKSFNEQQRQMDKIKSVNTELEQFVYVASHDLQEPLRTMSSYIGLIKELYIKQLDDNALKYMTHVEAASLRMKTLIKDLLDYSRLGKEKTITVVNTNTIVNDILLDFELLINDTNAIVLVEELPIVRGLESELKQLFQNLISNGLKFRRKDTAPQIEIKVEDKRAHWLFSIKDNGIGMEKKYFDRVFIIFQRLHNRDDYIGTGIGLSVCKKIVHMHKGEIWIESELNQGSTFYFTIFKNLKKI